MSNFALIPKFSLSQAMKSRKFINFAFILVTLSALTAGLSSCGTSKHATTQEIKRSDTSASSSQSVKFNSGTNIPDQAKGLISEANKWLGTPYRYGGTSRKGVDCSGFVLQVYREALDIKLPRNSAKQFEYCSRVKPSELMAGDLVFFATSRKSSGVSHVGLYVGDGKMIHASSSKGVIVTNLSDDYYTRTFVGAGRVQAYERILSSASKAPSQDKVSASRTTSRQPAPPAQAPSVSLDNLPNILSISATTSSAPATAPQAVPRRAVRPSTANTRQHAPVPESTSSNRDKVLSSLPD